MVFVFLLGASYSDLEPAMLQSYNIGKFCWLKEVEVFNLYHQRNMVQEAMSGRLQF